MWLGKAHELPVPWSGLHVKITNYISKKVVILTNIPGTLKSIIFFVRMVVKSNRILLYLWNMHYCYYECYKPILLWLLWQAHWYMNTQPHAKGRFDEERLRHADPIRVRETIFQTRSVYNQTQVFWLWYFLEIKCVTIVLFLYFLLNKILGLRAFCLVQTIFLGQEVRDWYFDFRPWMNKWANNSKNVMFLDSNRFVLVNKQVQKFQICCKGH